MAIVPKKEMYRRTIESLEASCRAHPDNPKLLQQLGQAYLKAGCFHPDALRVYEQVSEHFPTDIKIAQAVAFGYMLGQGQALLRDLPSLDDIDTESLTRTIDQLEGLARQYPDSADIHRAIGDIQLVRGEYREAVTRYRSALALGLEDLEPVCTHFENMQRLFPLPPNVVAFFAELFQRLGQYDTAQRLYQDLVDEGEVDPITLEAYYGFLTRRLSELQGNVDAMADTTRRLCSVGLMLGKQKEALNWARQLSPEAVAHDPALVKKLGRLLIDMGDLRQSFDYLSKIEIDHESKGLLNEITVLLEQRGELDTAVYLLQFINAHDTISKGSAASRKEAERTDKSDTSERKRRADLDIEVNTELQLAELHWKNRRWKMAFDAYMHVLELGYEDYRLILEPLDSLLERIPDVNEKHLAFLAGFFAERRDWKRTLFYAERALYLDPGLDDIRARLIQACEQILIATPDACEVRLKLGDVALEKGNIERAMKEFRKVATYPEYGMKANRKLALALARAGDTKAAFQKYQELPVLETQDLEHLYDLMISFQNTEQWKLALEAATLIRDFDPNFRDTARKIADYQQRVAAVGAEFAIDPKMRELIGDHSIGRYRYIEKIGSGGMGVVHKVVDLKTNNLVAMKILREGLSGSDKAIDRFFREARIAATLHHANIVNILDYNISNSYGQSYIAMEFVDGPSLRDIVEEKFSQTVEVDMTYVLEVLDWMMQVCDALSATHRKGIIHRDIKPDNIMLAPANVIKLTDFGIVHIEEATFTPTGALIGTPRYMSPEQVHGGRIDGRSDIYSVGIIMYEMLIGSPPFISGDISYQQVNVLPTPPREICGTIPELVDAIVMKCLEKNPSDRYQSSQELRVGCEEAFVRLGGNPERLQPSAPDAIPSAKVNNPAATTVDKPKAPVRPTPQRQTPARANRNDNWRTSSIVDDDYDLESELDLDPGDDERDRHDRVIRGGTRELDFSRPAPVRPPSAVDDLLSAARNRRASRMADDSRDDSVNASSETEDSGQQRSKAVKGIVVPGAPAAMRPPASASPRDSVDDLDDHEASHGLDSELDMDHHSDAGANRTAEEYSAGAPTRKLALPAAAVAPELDPDFEPSPRPFKAAAGLFDSELDLGENVEESPTAPHPAIIPPPADPQHQASELDELD